MTPKGYWKHRALDYLSNRPNSEANSRSSVVGHDGVAQQQVTQLLVRSGDQSSAVPKLGGSQTRNPRLKCNLSKDNRGPNEDPTREREGGTSRTRRKNRWRKRPEKLRQSYCGRSQSRWAGAEGLTGTSSLKKADMREHGRQADATRDARQRGYASQADER